MDDPSSPPPPERGAAEGGGAEPAPAQGTPRLPSADTIEPTAAHSQAARDAGDAARVLAHTARSFILYDAANEKIRDFLEETRTRIFAYLGAHGALSLDVRPWDILVGDEVVYTDHDREHSLAFRLYRDGVRTLVLDPELEWGELICLIGILSVRYKGFRTQEDDIVTLLWRAEFKHVRLTAVEGVVVGEDEASEGPGPRGTLTGPRTAMQALIFDAPYGFDYPWPNLAERAPVEYRPVPPTLLARFAHEDGTDAVPRECLALVGELMTGLADANDPLTFEEVLPALQETVGFLIGEGRLAELVEAMHIVQRLGPSDERARAKLLAACADEGIVRRLLRDLPSDLQTLPPAVLELLTLAPGDHLSTLLDLFTGDSRHVTPLLRQMLEGQVRGRGARIAERVRELDGKAAIELFRVIAKADPSGAVESAIELIGRPDEDQQLEALRFLDQAPYGAKVGRALVAAFGPATPAVRVRLFALLGRHRERRAFEPLVELVTRGAAADLTLVEAKAAGDALARLDPERARSVFREWIHPPGLRRLAPGQALLRWAALSGLAVLPGGDTEELLEWLHRHGGEDLARASVAALEAVRQVAGAPHAR